MQKSPIVYKTFWSFPNGQYYIPKCKNERQMRDLAEKFNFCIHAPFGNIFSSVNSQKII